MKWLWCEWCHQTSCVIWRTHCCVSSWYPALPLVTGPWKYFGPHPLTWCCSTSCGAALPHVVLPYLKGEDSNTFVFLCQWGAMRCSLYVLYCCSAPSVCKSSWVHCRRMVCGRLNTPLSHFFNNAHFTCHGLHQARKTEIKRMTTKLPPFLWVGVAYSTGHAYI